MSTRLYATVHESNAYAITWQACARTTACHPHLPPDSEHAKHALSAANNATSGLWMGSAALTGTCHPPELRQLWHTIPISTASPAV